MKMYRSYYLEVLIVFESAQTMRNFPALRWVSSALNIDCNLAIAKRPNGWQNDGARTRLIIILICFSK